MKSKKIALVALSLVNFLAYSQENIVELPLTMNNGYGPFNMTFTGIPPFSDRDENDPWIKTYPEILKLPEGLTDVKYSFIETNLSQNVYQNYLLGNLTETWYNFLQKSWNWIPDTLSLSKFPVKTKIAFAYGKNSEGILKIAVDTNNNLDLSDDDLFTPLIRSSFDWSKIDSLAQIYTVNVNFETFIHDKIIPMTIPIFIIYEDSQLNMFICNFSQYATTQFNGEQIAVFSDNFHNLSYNRIGVAFIRNLKNGEKVNKDNIFNKNEYLEINDEIYKILGVNTNKQTLVLEKSEK